MIEKIIISGFGGQGILLAGKLLAISAMKENKKVTYFPSYGAEMRGGTCNCSIVISDKQISSPIIKEPGILIVMNKPSLIKFEPLCKKDGKIFINNSLIKDKISRNDLIPYYIDSSNIADNLGNIKSANMVMLGYFSKVTNLISINSLIDSLGDVISSKNKNLIEINILSLQKGFDYI